MSNKEKHLLEMTRNREVLAGDPPQKERLEAIDEVEKELYEYFKDKNRCMGFCE